MMARPERVRILARNPWTFLRRRRLGWNVRFIGSWGVGRASSANWAERQRALAGGGGFQITPKRGTNRRMYAWFAGTSTLFLPSSRRGKLHRQGAGAPCRRYPLAAARVGLFLLCFGFVFVLCCCVGRVSKPVLYSATSQRGSLPPSPRASDFCDVNRLERYGYLLFNRCG